MLKKLVESFFTSPWGAVAVMLLAWAFMWGHVLFGDRLLFIRDLTFYALPMKSFMMAQFQNGQFPFWTPDISAGMPFFAELSHQVLYPFNLIFFLPQTLIPSIQHGISWFSILHHLLGIFAAYGLMRGLSAGRGIALWSALLYGLSGYALSITDNVNYLPAVAWVPAGLLCMIKGFETGRVCYGVLFSFCIALMILAGDTFNPFFLSVFCGIYLLFYRRAPEWFANIRFLKAGVFWILACLAGVSLSAVQLLPTWELIQESVRQSPLSYEEVTLWSFPPQRLIEFVQPFFYGSKYPVPHYIGMFMYPQFREPWAESIYLGLIPVALAVFGIRNRTGRGQFWLAVLFISLLLGFGGFAFYFPWLLKIFPPLQYHRYLEKLILWTTLSLCVLAGLGAQRFRMPEGRWLPFVKADLEKTFLFKAALTAVVLLSGWLILVQLPASLWIWPHTQERSLDWGGHLFDFGAHVGYLSGHTLLILAALATLIWIPTRKSQTLLKGLLLLGLLDLGLAHWNHVPTAPSSVLVRKSPPEALQMMIAQDQEGPYRVFYDDGADIPDIPNNPTLLGKIARATRQPVPEDSYTCHWVYRVLYNQERMLFNYGIVYGIEYLNGRFAPLQPLIHHQTEKLFLTYQPTLLMALSGVRYIITTAVPHNPAWEGSNYEAIGEDGGLNLRVLRFKGPLPKAYLVPNVLYNTDPDIYKIITPAFENYKSQVEIAALPPAGYEEKSALQPLLPDHLEILTNQPGFYEIQADSPYRQSYLVLTDGYFPGWEAEVDGRPVPVYRANHRFMGIEIPQGKHRIRCRYHATHFTSGCWISFLSLFLCLTVLLKSRKN